MDGRNLRVWLWGGLICAVVGCTPTASMVRSGNDGPVVHKAPTYEAYANFRATAAFSADKNPQQQQQFREEARLAYLKAIEVDPNYLPSYVGLARLYVRSEEMDAAVQTYRQVIQRAPNEAGLWHELGMSQCRQKKWHEGITSVQKACELNPGNKVYMKTLGYALARAGRFQESLGILVRIDGEAKAHYDLARMMKHLNEPESAKQLALMALSKDANLQGPREMLAEMETPTQQPGAVQTVSYQEVQPPVATTTPVPAVQEGTPVRMPPLPVISVGAKK